MKKKTLTLLTLTISILLAFSAFAEIIFDTNSLGPGDPASQISETKNYVSDNTITSQYNYEEKFTHTLSNGCTIECPLHMKTPNGTITIKDCRVKEADLVNNLKARFIFNHIGPNSISEKFYIRVYDETGDLIEEETFSTDYEEGYNAKKSKTTYKSVLTEETYYIPYAAAKIVVDNKVLTQ